MFFYLTVVFLQFTTGSNECLVKYNHTEISCLNEDSCFSENDTFLHEPTNCFCDQVCALYGDCCADLSRDTIFTHLGEEKLYTCVKNPAGDLPPFIYIYYKCPVDWEDNDIKKKCESPEFNNPFHFNPVTSNASGWTYKNSFCAICNYEFESDLIYWGLMVKCPYNFDMLNVSSLQEAFDQQFVYYSCFYGTWFLYLKDNSTSLPCTKCTSLPPQNITVRGCIPHISKCANNWTDDSVKKKCYNYTAYRYYEENIYKNEYCAKCNYVSVEKLTCKKALKLNDNIEDCSSYNISLSVDSTCLYEPTADKSCRPDMIYKIGKKLN